MLCRYKGKGIHIKPDGTPAIIGEELELTQSQYDAFKDRFTLIEQADFEEKELPYFGVKVGTKFHVFHIETGEQQTDVLQTRKEVLDSYPTIQLFDQDDCPYKFELKEKLTENKSGMTRKK